MKSSPQTLVLPFRCVAFHLFISVLELHLGAKKKSELDTAVANIRTIIFSTEANLVDFISFDLGTRGPGMNVFDHQRETLNKALHFILVHWNI
jgi:hypothetical protein